MNFSVENLCNIGGCVLIFILLALLLFKPNGLMSLIEGQNNNNNSKKVLIIIMELIIIEPIITA